MFLAGSRNKTARRLPDIGRSPASLDHSIGERLFLMLAFEIIGGLFILLFFGPMLSGGQTANH
jgi:hypothetical protein